MDEAIFCDVPLLTPAGRVMRPRPASEGLVATALSFIAGRDLRVVDVGTGSGALTVAIARAAPAADVWATDTSADAVSVARANAARHGLGDRVSVRLGSLLDPVPGEIDLVVANLPYLPAAEASQFPELAREPHEAVFAPGDGLDPYRKLLEAADVRLSPQGAVIIQLHRRVHAAGRGELSLLRAEIEAALAPVAEAA